jgi:hypothetical protein
MWLASFTSRITRDKDGDKERESDTVDLQGTIEGWHSMSLVMDPWNLRQRQPLTRQVTSAVLERMRLQLQNRGETVKRRVSTARHFIVCLSGLTWMLRLPGRDPI